MRENPLGMGRTRRIALLGAASLLVFFLAVPGGAKQLEIVSLEPGDHAFWSGRARTTYEIDLAPGGRRLRVAVDDGDLAIESAYTVDVIDPRGRSLAGGPYEVFVDRPQPGTWLINVLPEANAKSFRLRAKLEGPLGKVDTSKLLKPNLRPEPGYDFTFSWTEENCDMFTGSSACDPGGPVAVPPSCAADETAEDLAARCLRFAMGYQNAGLGPVDLHFGELDVVSGTVGVTQWVYRADATEDWHDNKHVEVKAGTASYHKTHGHYHYDNIFGAKLFSADPVKKTVEPLGDVAKRGACAHDYVFVDFERFYQARKNSADSGSDCSFLFTEPNARTRIGLSPGWADIYTAGLSDNYVDFGVNLDGYYVLRFYSDIDGTIEETNENDNVAYSYIKVSGFDVELLERGRGRDPWDPNKVVLRGLGD